MHLRRRKVKCVESSATAWPSPVTIGQSSGVDAGHLNLDRSSPANLQSAVLTHRLTARHVKWLSDVVSTPPFVSAKPGHAQGERGIASG